MDLKTKNIQLQYEGFLNTRQLWKNNEVFGLQQFELSNIKSTTFEGLLQKNQRLGKRVESFLSHLLKQDSTIKILVENSQIQNKKITVGELDFLIEHTKRPIHLEVIYKFYLYDTSVGETELEHWIGPNRRDSLVSKLTKLKDKQLPLLYNLFTKPLLTKLNLNSETIKQQVLFKAQLFIPYQAKNIEVKPLNYECINGFYINFNELQQFNNCKFYIPSKINWLQEIQIQTKWQSFEQFLQTIELFLNQKSAPLCWIKHPNGETEKFFVVWW